MQKTYHPPKPIHIAGTARGEEMVLHKGREAGRASVQGNGTGYRSARDSTGICAKQREPIVAGMGHIPPA